MAETTSRELLQPALLDRLTDDEPQKQVESRDHRILSMRAFREGVMRDLAWLLNTGNFDADGTFEECPQVADSVLNFGIRDLCGMTTSGISEGDLERYVREAIRRFEPRILPKSLTVRVKVSKDSHSYNAVIFEISGDLWAGAEAMALTLLCEMARGGEVQLHAALMNDGALATKLREADISVAIFDESRLSTLAIFAQLRNRKKQCRPAWRLISITTPASAWRGLAEWNRVASF